MKSGLKKMKTIPKKLKEETKTENLNLEDDEINPLEPVVEVIDGIPQKNR